MLTGPLRCQLVLPKSAQFRGSIGHRRRAAEMSYAEWERADHANESIEHLVQTFCIRLRDWAGDPLALQTLKLVSVPRWIRPEKYGGVLTVGVAAIERS